MQSKQNYHINKISLIFLALVTLNSCKKFVEIDPPVTQISSNTVFTSDATATSAMAGVYSQMMQQVGSAAFPNGSPTILMGISSDELQNFSSNPDYNEFGNNNIKPPNTEIQNLWNQGYKYIYDANAIIEGLNSSNGVSPAVKEELIGEARFCRAFCNFYLVNFFGNIPSIVSTDYRVNEIAFRIDRDSIYKSIIHDLTSAQDVLSTDYSFSKGERIRPNKWAANALLSRVYLFNGDWANSEKQASSVIQNVSLYSLVPDLNAVFLKNSSESIWQLLPVAANYNYSTEDAYWFIPSNGAKPNAALNSTLLQAFELNDQRKINWVDSVSYSAQLYYLPFKYKVTGTMNSTEYYTVLRLAEQFLNRAEARAKQNNIADAETDLNIIRNRAGLPSLHAGDQTQLLGFIQHERQIELFAEWGFRWLDLKRTGTADAILGPIKAPIWQSTDTLYPIPHSEIGLNPNLTQNPGY